MVEPCIHAPERFLFVCVICDKTTEFYNVSKLLEVINTRLKANPPISDYFMGYRQALEEIRELLVKGKQAKISGE